MMVIALLLGAIVLGLVLVETVIRRTDVGAGLVLGLILLQEGEVADLTIRAGPFNVFPRDLLFVVLAIAATARLLRIERPTGPQRILLVFGAVVTWSVVRGIGISGVAGAVNGGRGYLLFTVAVLYFSTVERRRDVFDRIGHLWLWASAVLCMLVMLRWGANAVGLSGGVFSAGASGGALRVISADSALVVGQAALIGVPALRDPSAGIRRLITPVSLVFVVLLQHRSVWIVIAVGLAYLLHREKALNVRVIAGLMAGLVLAGVLSVAMLGDGYDVAGELSASATGTGTFEWRIAGWQALMTESGPDTTAELVLGQPFGSGWDRTVDGRFIDVSPHNHYLSTLLRVGVVGLAMLLALYAIALRGIRAAGLRPAAGHGTLSDNVLITLVAGQLLYFIPYGPDVAQAMLLGLACAAVSAARHSDRPPFDRGRAKARG